MTKKNILIKKNDYNRVVLLDVLPYELPFILTNEGFYSFLHKNLNSQPISKVLNDIFFSKNVDFTYPLKYKIKKDRDNERTLSLIHPKAQIKLTNLYQKYNQFMLYLCSKSSFSLRFPNKLAIAYIEKKKHLITDVASFKDENINLEEEDSISTNSFFEYKHYSFLYKFYDSYEFQKLEKRFNFLYKFDIAKCFGCISTFQLSKAIRGELNYNSTKNTHSFENEFENIMLFCNADNSHGIIVGPEFSRIYAEILLQCIDLKIKQKISNIKLVEGKDYVIKRYVDDYFLFFNNESSKSKIHKIVTDTLEDFSLYSNEAKNIEYSIPFLTGVTAAKQDVNNLLTDYFTETTPKADEDFNFSKFNFPSKKAIKLINQVKNIVYKNNIQYSSITGYFFSIVKENITNLETSLNKWINDENSDSLTNYFLIILDAVFFVYSMDFRVRSTYLVSQIIILVNEKMVQAKVKLLSNNCFSALNSINNNINRIKKKIHDETYQTLNNAISKGQIRSIESLNLLIAIRYIDPDNCLPESTLAKVIGIRLDDYIQIDVTYFQLMTVLFYSYKNKTKYQKLLSKVFDIINQKFKLDGMTVFNNSELAHLFFDTLSCPFVNKKIKLGIFNNALLKCDIKYQMDNKEKEQLFEYITTNKWFIDWKSSSIDAIKKLLKKKELRQPYGE